MSLTPTPLTLPGQPQVKAICKQCKHHRRQDYEIYSMPGWNIGASTYHVAWAKPNPFRCNAHDRGKIDYSTGKYIVSRKYNYDGLPLCTYKNPVGTCPLFERMLMYWWDGDERDVAGWEV